MGKPEVWKNSAIISACVCATPIAWSFLGAIIYLIVLAGAKVDADVQTPGQKAFNILFVDHRTATGGQKLAHFLLILVIYWTVAYVASAILLRKNILQCKNGTYSDCTKSSKDQAGALGQIPSSKCERVSRLTWAWGALLISSLSIFPALVIYAPLVMAQKKYAAVVAIAIALVISLFGSAIITAKSVDNCFFHCDSAEETERTTQCGGAYIKPIQPKQPLSS